MWRLSPPCRLKAAVWLDRFLVGYYGYYGIIKGGGRNPNVTLTLTKTFGPYIEVILVYIFRVCFHFRYIVGMDVFGKIVFACSPYARSIRQCYSALYVNAK